MGKSKCRNAKSLAANIHQNASNGSISKKKKEINDIIEKLLKVSSQNPGNGKIEWEAYLEIDKLLQKLQELQSGFDVHRNREDNFLNMILWIKENGGITDNIAISKFDGMDYGLEATKDLKEGEMICVVPRNVMMTLENVKDSPLKHLYLNDPILKNMGNVALTLFLIIEYLKGDKSFWYSYISTLPVKYNTVLYFTVEDLNELKCSPTLEPSLKQCKNIARQYAYFYKLFQMSNDEASLTLRNTFTYQLYCWAASTVMTRQNLVPSEDGDTSVNGLIPLWDMCNHVNGYLSTQYGGNRSECLACRPFAKGEQVLIFYGERSNADFLVHNGFVYPENNYDSFRLHLGVSRNDKLYHLRCELLKALRIPVSGDFYIYSGSEPIREQMLAFLRIFSMEREHLEQWKSSDRLNDLMRKDCAFDTKIESKVWNFLMNRLSLLLATYGQDLEADDSTLTESRRLVRTQMSLEKKFLKLTIEYVQQHIKA